eukprot:scaffold3354_cov369-Prasinococcus_capsulatus_cf.AAC.4
MPRSCTRGRRLLQRLEISQYMRNGSNSCSFSSAPTCDESTRATALVVKGSLNRTASILEP